MFVVLFYQLFYVFYLIFLSDELFVVFVIFVVCVSYTTPIITVFWKSYYKSVRVFYTFHHLMYS